MSVRFPPVRHDFEHEPEADDLAPARGCLLGMAIGLALFAIVIGWWLS